MSAPTKVDLAAAITSLNAAADKVLGTSGEGRDAVQAAIAEIETAASHLSDEEELADTSYDLEQLADHVARLHYDEHVGALRFCSRQACRSAFELGTDVVA